MDKAYYTKYYTFEREHWWFTARLTILDKYISENILSRNNLEILNIGTATGATSEMLSKKGNLVSIEYDKDCIAFTKSKLDIDIRWGDILNLDFAENSFDLVCAFDVIEHVEDHAKAVYEMMRVCKAGGDILITVPAHMHMWSEHDLVNHHYRRYEIDELKTLVNNTPGCNISYISYFNSYFYYPILIARKIKNVITGNLTKKGELKSDFESFKSGTINQIMRNIFAHEKNKIAAKKTFKNGVSLIAHIKKLK